MNVVLYTKHCPKCTILETKLNHKGIPFESITDESIMLEKSFLSLPMLEVDGNTMDFATANKWVNAYK